MTLTVFDLDHTLLAGDTDVLWCRFLMDCGQLDRAAFAGRNAAMERRYASGTVSPREFCEFYVGTLADRTPADWRPWRERFAHEVLWPRLPQAARDLVARHQDAGELVVLSTATCRFLAEPSAARLGFAHLLATECALDARGAFSGRVDGEPNMRDGKVTRLLSWLAARGLAFDTLRSCFYSDSINDLPLLERVHEPVAVDPSPALAEVAAARGWPVLNLHRPAG